MYKLLFDMSLVSSGNELVKIKYQDSCFRKICLTLGTLLRLLRVTVVLAVAAMSGTSHANCPAPDELYNGSARTFEMRARQEMSEGPGCDVRYQVTRVDSDELKYCLKRRLITTVVDTI